MSEIKGLLFDLDGVLVDTAKYHFLAWRKMANDLGIDFTEEQNEELKGVSRRNSILKILAWGGIEMSDTEIERLMALKNDWYLEYIDTLTPNDVLPGADVFLKDCKAKGFKIALGSASKNAVPILNHLKLTALFDAIIDGNVVTASKPDPAVFAQGADALQLNPEQCLVFEDAKAGIEAAKKGGMKAIGIGQKSVLGEADLVLAGLNDHQIEDILSVI